MSALFVVLGMLARSDRPTLMCFLSLFTLVPLQCTFTFLERQLSLVAAPNKDVVSPKSVTVQLNG